MLDLLKAHKWIYIKMMADGAPSLNKKRSIDKRARKNMLKLETVIKPHVETSKPSSIEKLNKKKGIDKKTRQNSDKIPTKPKLKKLTAKPHRESKPGAVAVAGLIMHLRLVSGRGGSLLAEHYTRDVRKALVIAERLKAAGLRPNIVKSALTTWYTSPQPTS